MRRPLSTKARLALFLAHEGRCHVCGGKIAPGEGWDVEHRIPLAMGGEDGGDNLAPVHRKGCHESKTAADLGDIAKAKRRQAKHLGVKKPRTMTRWRRFSGEIVIKGRER